MTERRNQRGVFRVSVCGEEVSGMLPSVGARSNRIVKLQRLIVSPYDHRKLEQVVNMVEDVVEAVEDVAEVVEHVADKVGDNLPDNTPLKCVALWVENAAKEVGDDAEQAKDFIDKVEDLTEEVEKKVDQPIDSFRGDEGEAVQKETNAVGLKEEVGQPLIEQEELIMKEEAPVKEELIIKEEAPAKEELIIKEEGPVKEEASTR